MKKKLLFLSLPAMLLALFLSACGKTPDEELQSKVPASANGLVFLDGNNFMKTKLYSNIKNDVVKELKKASLSEEFFQCRILVALSTREEWAGILIQSADKQVKTIFEHALANIRKDQKKFKNVKESEMNGERMVSATMDKTKMFAIFYHDNLMLIGVNKTDPAFFNAETVNPLFKDIRMQGMILSSAVKVEIPQQGKGKDSADLAFQMIPALRKLNALSLNIPFSAEDPSMDFRMIFNDDQAAGEMLATVNMGLGFAAQGGPEYVDFVQKLNRKAEKNIFSLSFKLKDAEEFGRKVQDAQKKKEQQLKAAKQAQKQAQPAAKKPAAPAKETQSAAQKPADPATKAQPAAQKPVAPAKAQPAAQKPAAPAKEAQPAAQKPAAPATKAQPSAQKPAAPAAK